MTQLICRFKYNIGENSRSEKIVGASLRNVADFLSILNLFPAAEFWVPGRGAALATCWLAVAEVESNPAWEDEDGSIHLERAENEMRTWIGLRLSTEKKMGWRSSPEP